MTNPPKPLEERASAAIQLAHSYAQIDDSHHKMWVIDQMLRQLLGENYDEWVAGYETCEEDCKQTNIFQHCYTWDVGIPP